MDHEAPIYQQIVLANDSSESHLKYISAMVDDENITPDQIRTQFMKSIEALPALKEK